MQDIRKLTVLGRFSYGSIPTITQFVADAAEAALLDEDAVFHCQMAVDEACTNVIEHAYGENPNSNFEITCAVEPGKCTIEIVDQGKRFDPTSVPPPEISQNLDDIRPGGVGIHLIKQLMDEVRFEYTGRGNTLTLVKTSPQLVKSYAPVDIPVRDVGQGVWVIQPAGQVDSLVASQLDQVIASVMETGRNHLVVDLTGVTYISSKGLKALVSGWRAARGTGGNMVICGIAPRVQIIVDTIGLNQVLSIFTTLDEAIQAVSADAR